MTAQCLVTWWPNLIDTSGEQQEFADWRELFQQFANPKPFRGEKTQPGWSPAEFNGERKGENVRRAYAFCLDYDNKNPKTGEQIAEPVTFEQACERWRGMFGFIHTTRSHRAEWPRFRVILPLSRPVSRFEYYELWKRLKPHAGPVDDSPKDPSRFWFTPGPERGSRFNSLVLEGTALDPDEWLSRPDPTLSGVPIEHPTVRDPNAVERRAIAYLARMPEAISGQGGQKALWAAALVLARGFSLGKQRTFEILRAEYNPRCVPVWTEKELERASANAASALAPDGFKLADDRQGRWVPENAPAWQLEPPAGFFERFDSDSASAEGQDEYSGPHREPGDDSEQIADESAAPVPAVERYKLRSLQDLMGEVVAEMRKPRPRQGAPTGIDDFDSMMGGYRAGNVTIFGAKRGFGKTSYGNLVVNETIPAFKVALFAGEDAASMYGKRFLAARAGLNALRLRDYRCDKSDWPAITRALNDAPNNPFFLQVEGRPVEWIARVIREVAAEQGLDLVIVDYLQCLISAKQHQDRRNEVTYICRTLTDAIKAAGAAGLVFSQLKRTERVEPEIEDLKESGDLEDMSDHVILGWKLDGSANESARRMVKLGKNKDGPEGSEMAPIELRWSKKTASFEHTPGTSDSYAYTDLTDDFAGVGEDARYP